MGYFPRVPESRTPAEFATIVFVLVIASVVVLATIGVATVEIVDPETDTDQIVVLIGVITAALFGFVCGRSSIREEWERALLERPVVIEQEHSEQ